MSGVGKKLAKLFLIGVIGRVQITGRFRYRKLPCSFLERLRSKIDPIQASEEFAS